MTEEKVFKSRKTHNIRCAKILILYVLLWKDFFRFLLKLNFSQPILKCLAFCFTLRTTASTIFSTLSFTAFFINRPLNFLLITRFDFFLFLFDQTNHFDIKLVLFFLTVDTTITVISILKFPVFDHLRSKLDSQFLQLTDIGVITWLIKGNSCTW